MSNRKHSRSLRRALIVAGAVFLAALPAQAQEGETQTQPEAVELSREMDGAYIVMWASANLRAEPSSQSERLAQMPLGEVVTVTGLVAGGDWYQVETQEGARGYVWTENLAPLRVDFPVAGGGGSQDGASDSAMALLPPSDDNHFGVARVVEGLGQGPVSDRGMVGPADTVDYYRFTLDEWTSVQIDLHGLNADADIYLTGEDDHELSSSTNAAAEAEWIDVTLGPGAYYLTVERYEGATNYDITFTAAPAPAPPADTAGDRASTARDLGVLSDEGFEVEEWLGSQDYSDYFTFEVSVATKVGIVIDGHSEDIDLYVHDANASTTLASSTAGGDAIEDAILDLEPGRYTIGVEFYGGQQSDYRLSVFAIARTVD